ncbi:transgelin [Plakobranchus ocellatus]|uniref:Transgelin n=1 Tax=Plakobranchus ocellatus TaxID=259542 RepID=A0AAV3ZXY6_9GAST|nr:transgelin [Plakobranchus ocellatus]
MSSKWEPERAKIAVAWVGERIGVPLTTTGEMDDVHQLFKNGVYLAMLTNWVKPGSIEPKKYAKPPTMAFKQMELIGEFLAAIDASQGGLVKKAELFQTVDLYEAGNMVQVVITIEALGRALVTQGREGFGKAESKGQAHEWTEEQLREGQKIIGLQMGSNKGASQSGQNFGKTRAIMD